MNHVTIDTAKRLKESGFAPVRADFGQVWYDESGEPFLIAGLTTSGYSIAKANEFGKKSSLDGCVFAPTATDIMKELGRDFSISYMNGEWFVLKSSGDFLPFSKSPSVWKHIISAEAAAMAWLALNKKI